MQIVGIDANVTNNSPTVSVQDGTDLSAVVPGCLFKVQGSLVVYKITAVSGANITISPPFSEPTTLDADCIIQLSFTPKKGLPIVQSGEIDANEFFSYALSVLDNN